MLALDLGEHEGARDAIEHVSRGRSASPLLEPCIPVGLMLARWATSSRRSPGVRRRSAAKPKAAGSSFVRRSLR